MWFGITTHWSIVTITFRHLLPESANHAPPASFKKIIQLQLASRVNMTPNRSDLPCATMVRKYTPALR